VIADLVDERDDETSFIVRLPGAWHRTSAAEPGGTEISFQQVLVTAPPRGLGEASIPTTIHQELSAQTQVAPAWCLVAEVRPEGLYLASVDGTQIEADHDTLRLLDALHEVTTIGHLRSALNGLSDDLLERVSSHGWIRLPFVPAEVEAPQDQGDTTPNAAPLPTVAVPTAEACEEPLTLLRRAAARAANARHRRRDDRSDPGSHTAGASEVRDGSTDGDDRIPVYAIWHVDSGPMLSLGMLTASLRHHRSGLLNAQYDIRAPESAESFLADLSRRTGPAVLLCSDYVWSLNDNLDVANRALAIAPDLLVVHGGPSCPKYEGDAEDFIRQHGRAGRILTRGEGEYLVCELLEALAPHLPQIDPDVLSAIAGLTFRDERDGQIVRTADRDRIAQLDDLPSPYLTGEFDAIPKDAWSTTLSIETNRGCPYGCSYCDWGSSTLSRVRKFSHDRVRAEIEWATSRGLDSLNITDANFGIMARDVDVAEVVAAQRRATGYPKWVSFYPAKNTTKHLVKIMDLFVGAGVSTIASISLQTTDEATLDAIERSNISTDHYVELAASYRRRGYPLQGELILGLPGQTYDSYRRDLQFNLDHEIQTRTWRLRVLPNAPMNDPAYRERFEIVVDDNDLVHATATFTEEDRLRMVRLQSVDIICERLGLLRHVLRVVQWEHGVDATVVMDKILEVVNDGAATYPHLCWVMNQFHHYATAPGGWNSFYAEVRSLLASEFGVEASPALDVAFELNQFLMPVPGRPLPASITLAHDYLAYYRDATRSLYRSGHAQKPQRRLEDYPPSVFTISGDPLRLCTEGLTFFEFTSTDGMDGDFAIGANSANELLSPLTRLLPHLITEGVRLADLGPDAPAAQGLGLPDEPKGGGTAVELIAVRSR